jgi:hypothetical protein
MYGPGMSFRKLAAGLILLARIIRCDSAQKERALQSDGKGRMNQNPEAGQASFLPLTVHVV